MDDEIVATAQRLLLRAELRVREEDAAARLSATIGLRCTPIWPPSEVIKIVTFDGVVIGRVRRQYPRLMPERWIAVPIGPARRRGPYRSAAMAAAALAALANEAVTAFVWGPTAARAGSAEPSRGREIA